ncbi:MAG: DUF11 domain-containing protein, partial [Allobaculum sp.]|nr:DUF11 domain-containing protein [Allobaculum sp.]
PTKKDSNEVVSKSDNPDDPDITIVKEQRKISGGVTSAYNKQGPSNPMSVEGGDVVEYKLTVSNPTSTTAQNVVLTDTIPTPEPNTSANFTLVRESIQGNNISLQGNTITWNLGDLAPNSTKSVTFRVNVPTVTKTTTWTNIATVTSGSPEDRQSKDSNKVTTKEIPDDSSITILKEQRKITQGISSAWNQQGRPNPMQVNGGDVVEYRVTVKNTGSTALSNVVVQDEIPPYEGSPGNLTLVADSLSGNVTIKNGIITWNVGTLQPSQSQSVTFRVNVPTTQGQTLWANTAYVSYGEDPNNPDKTIPSNTVAIKENPASSHINLLKEQRKIVNGVTSTWNTQDRNNPMIVNGGDIVEYRLTATVIGSAPLNNVTIKDTVPNFEGAAGDLVLLTSSLGPNATVVGKTITWNLGTMQPGQTQSVTFQVQVPTTAGQTLWANIATVSYGNDPNNPDETVPSNTVAIEENPALDLSLLKEQRLIRNGVTYEWNTQDRSNPMSVQPNDVVEYRLTLTNKTMNSVPNVVIKDTIPSPSGSTAQLTLLEQTTTKGTVRVDGRTIIWTLGTLAPQEVVTVFFKVQVPNVEATTLWPNVATATYGEDPNNPTGQVPSNEVDIREPVESKTPTSTPPTTTTPGGTTNITNNNTNITNNSTINNPSSNKTSEITSKTPASNNGSNALTSTETNARFWAMLFCAAILCLGVGTCYSQRKRTH